MLLPPPLDIHMFKKSILPFQKMQYFSSFIFVYIFVFYCCLFMNTPDEFLINKYTFKSMISK